MVHGSSISTRIEIADERIVRELALIPTSYGRLVYLAGLLDPNTGRYQHYGSGSALRDREVSLTLRRCHEAIFQEWVSFNLEAKMSDLEFYVAGLEDVDCGELVDAWLRLTPYKNLVPASIQGPERQKHVSDFEAILGLLKNVYGVASPDLGA